MASLPLRISDPVYFQYQHQRIRGFVADIQKRTAFIVTDRGQEFKVPIAIIQIDSQAKPKRVYTGSQLRRLEFETGDEVQFSAGDGRPLTGAITVMNPKRARIKCGPELWDVPYEKLQMKSPVNRGRQRQAQLDEIARMADELLARHHLRHWRFIFDDARTRGGMCSSRDQIISVSKQFCLSGAAAQIKDTLLHEIAHALVGPNHGHDEVWRAKALEIGCTAERTLNAKITQPRFIMSCHVCGWHQTRHKRQRLVCKHCAREVEYAHYSDELWARCRRR